LVELARVGPLDQACRPDGLPTRYLPPGRPSNMFLLYQASWAQSRITAASRCTFTRCWHMWEGVLRFRKSSCHSKCSECFRLQAKIRKSGNFTSQINAQMEYLQHINDQLADRKQYWGLRERARMKGDICSLIVDGIQ
jgi:hypothetical protein